MNTKVINTSRVVPTDNRNSSDAISGHFINGCLGGCWNTYCYASRYNFSNIYISKNWSKVIDKCIEWAECKPWPKVPNQQDPKWYMFDIGCNSDLPLMQKYFRQVDTSLYDILLKFAKSERCNSTFATKYSYRLNLDVRDLPRKPRVRISIMPHTPMEVLEPNTTILEKRITDYYRLKELGWEVHWNFSPVVMYDGWKKDYKDLIKRLQPAPCEVIFMTNHNNSMSRASTLAREYMGKVSEVKNTRGVMRYPLVDKSQGTTWLKQTLVEHGFTVRYIF